MDKFTKACRLACEQWVDSLPQDVPTHHFSPAFEEAVRPLLQPNITAVPKKKRKFTKKTLKILVAAAVLLAIAVATTVIAKTGIKKSEIKQFSGHAEYELVNPGEAEDVNDLTVGYVPSGFVCKEKYEEKFEYAYYYYYYDNHCLFSVQKLRLSENLFFNNKPNPGEPIDINGVEGVYFYRADPNFKGIIFNNGEYIFMIDGNISKEELVKIAQNVR